MPHSDDQVRPTCGVSGKPPCFTSLLVIVAGGYSRNASRTTASAYGNCSSSSSNSSSAGSQAEWCVSIETVAASRVKSRVASQQGLMYLSPQPYGMVMVAGGYSRNASRTTASASGNCTGSAGGKGTPEQEQHVQAGEAQSWKTVRK
jgi:hypothetical protein